MRETHHIFPSSLPSNPEGYDSNINARMRWGYMVDSSSNIVRDSRGGEVFTTGHHFPYRIYVHLILLLLYLPPELDGTGDGNEGVT